MNPRQIPLRGHLGFAPRRVTYNVTKKPCSAVLDRVDVFREPFPEPLLCRPDLLDAGCGDQTAGSAGS